MPDKVKQNKKPEPICDRVEVGLWDTDFDSSEVRLSSVTKMGRYGILCNEKMPKTRNNNSGFTQVISRSFYSMPQPNQSACGWMWVGFYFLFNLHFLTLRPCETFQNPPTWWWVSSLTFSFWKQPIQNYKTRLVSPYSNYQWSQNTNCSSVLLLIFLSFIIEP